MKILSTFTIIGVTIGILYYSGFLSDKGETIVEETVTQVGSVQLGEKQFKDITMHDLVSSMNKGINTAKGVTNSTKDYILFDDGSIIRAKQGTLTVNLQSDKYKKQIERLLKEHTGKEIVFNKETSQ